MSRRMSSHFPGLVLHVGRRDGIKLEVETGPFGLGLEERQRFSAERGVEVEIADRLALQRVDRAAAEIFQDFRGAVRIGDRRVEHPGEDLALGGG